jgi:hypothetical protein
VEINLPVPQFPSSDMISDIRYKTDVSIEILLEASRQAHGESLAAIADFAKGKADPRQARR